MNKLKKLNIFLGDTLRTAVYPGSLDPITFGHVEAIKETAACFDRVIAAIGVNPSKNYLFSLAEREALARQALADIPNVEVASFSGLLVHFLVRNNWDIVVRGIRSGQDLSDAVLQDTIGWQQSLASQIHVLYVPSRPGQTFVSSTALKGVLKEQGSVTLMAPVSTIHATRARMLGQYLYGVTGASGAGKSTLCHHFKRIAQERSIPLEHFDLDGISQNILEEEGDPLYAQTRLTIGQAFGDGVVNPDGSINKKKLGQQVYADPSKLKLFNGIMQNPAFFRLNDKLRGRRGVFLIEAELLAEAEKMHMVNNHLALIKTDPQHLADRLSQRNGLTQEQLSRRLNSPYSDDGKNKKILAQIEADRYGNLLTIPVGELSEEKAAQRAFDFMLSQIDLFGELRGTGFLKTMGVPSPEAVFAEVQKRYNVNDRFYHTFFHIVDGWNLIPDFQDELSDPVAFNLGWCWHDETYNTHNKDNEEASAESLKKAGRHWGLVQPSVIERAARFILVTKHGVVKPETKDEKLIVDLDMSILGKSESVYDAYEYGVRREYGWLSESDWKKGRGAFLQSLKPPIFYTRYFSERYERQARINIARSLKRLSQS